MSVKTVTALRCLIMPTHFGITLPNTQERSLTNVRHAISQGDNYQATFGSFFKVKYA